MRAVLTVAITVEVPDGTDLAGLYLNLPYEQIEVLDMNRRDQPLDATIEGHETISVNGGQE